MTNKVQLAAASKELLHGIRSFRISYISCSVTELGCKLFKRDISAFSLYGLSKLEI